LSVLQVSRYSYTELNADGLVIDRSLNTNTSQRTNFHLSSQSFEVIRLTNHGANVTTQEAQWNGDQTWRAQWEEGPVSVSEHGRVGTGDCWGEENQYQTGNETAVNGPDSTGGVELAPVQGVQNGWQVCRCCNCECQGYQERNVRSHRQDARDNRGDAEDDHWDVGNGELLFFRSLAITQHRVVDVVRNGGRCSNSQTGHHCENGSESDC